MKKGLIFWIIIFLVFLVGCVNQIMNKDIYFDKYCNLTNNGFVCVLDEKQNSELLFFHLKCNESQGSWFRAFSCAGICFETDKYFCYYPYSDGDKICNNSEECEGLCIIDYGEGIKLIEELGG